MRKFCLRVLALVCSFYSIAALAETAGSAAALSARYGELTRAGPQPGLGPLHLASSDNGSHLEGDIYAVLSHPFEETEAALSDLNNWCDILMLHLNVKYCRSTGRASGADLAIYLGRKTAGRVEDAYRLDFTFAAPRAESRYLMLQLGAPEGPLGTRNYRMLLEAAPLGGQTVMHFSYAYDYGMAARVALGGYLSTLGAGKVGFTETGREHGRPVYVQGLRGIQERNTVRYYLAIEVWLDGLKEPESARLNKRLNNWFDATERYATQLHEVDREDYLDMKRGEFARQRASAS